MVCVPSGGTVSDIFYKKALQQKFEEAMLVASSDVLVEKARMQGIHAVTFDALANAVLEQRGAGQGDRFVFRKISRKAQELILQEILDSLLQEGKLPYFGKLTGKKGFIRSMTSLMDQIGSCGATAEEIETAFAHWDGRPAAYCQKDREIAEIYRRYLDFLIRNNLSDVSGLYRMAAEKLAALRKEGGVKWIALYFTGFYQFDALQLMIIRLLSRVCDVWVALPYEPGRPGLYGAAEFTYGDLMQYAVQERLPFVTEPERPASLRHIVRNLRSPEKKPVPADPGVEIWQLSDSMEEMRAVLREIKRQLRNKAVKPSETAVVVRRMEEYSGIRDLCDEYGIPLQAEDSAALAASPVFGYISAFLAAVSSHGREKAETWTAFLTQPLQRIVLGLRTEVAAQLSGGTYYTDYRNYLTDVLQKTQCGALRQLWQETDAVPAEATVQEYCEITDRILSLTELPDKAGRLYREGRIPLTGFKNIACACKEIRNLLRKLPQDYRFSRYGELKIPCAGFAEELAEAAAKISIPLQPENREGVAFLSAVNLEDAFFKQVYVLGLREDEFPFYKDENWIYNDRERADLADLGIRLPSAADAYREDIHFFMNACAAATERLVLTCYADEEHYASPYIAEIQALFTDLPVQVRKAETDAGDSLSREELELALARAGQITVLQQLEPGLADAGDSDRRRMKNETDWNGNLGDAALTQQVIRQIGDRFSASKLNAYRECPFRFLVTCVWQQSPAEEAGEDIDPGQRGNLLHRVLELFIGRHLGEKLQESRHSELQQELDGIFDTVCREFAEKGRLYPGDFWQHDKELQRNLLRGWLRSEISYSGQGEWRPAYTEQGFGLNGKDEMPLDVDGRRIYLTGKIDRIDRAGDTYFITDYKSGDTPGKKEFMDTDLQMPLYLLAAERFLAAAPEGAAQADGAVTDGQAGRVAGGGYYSLKDGKRKSSFLFASAAAETVPWETFSEAEDENGTAAPVADITDLEAKMKQVLGGLLERMRQGDFRPDPAGCRSGCPAKGICRYRILTETREEEGSDG